MIKQAGVIHIDFEKGFIKAETISFADYVKYGSESACKDAGKFASKAEIISCKIAT